MFMIAAHNVDAVAATAATLGLGIYFYRTAPRWASVIGTVGVCALVWAVRG